MQKEELNKMIKLSRKFFIFLYNFYVFGVIFTEAIQSFNENPKFNEFGIRIFFF